jgi:hypothetical protein
MSFSSVTKLSAVKIPHTEHFSFQSVARELLLKKVASFPITSVLEFLPAAETLPFTANYTALDAHTLSPACEFSVENASTDLLLSSFSLDLLRMDQLYMFFSEARRVVKPGAYLAIAGLGEAQGVVELLRQKWWCLKNKRKILRVVHYISPEDWQTILQENVSAEGMRCELLILKRL